MRTALLALFLLGTPPVLATGCGEPAEQIRSQKVTAGCGTCQYRRTDGVGCYWVIELDGKTYPVTGALPKDHENHAPTGMCNMKRTVIVDGELAGGTFIATRFELEPAETAPEAPAFTEDDLHDGSWDASKMKGE